MTEKDQKPVQLPEHLEGISLVDSKIASLRACGLKLMEIEPLVGLDQTTISVHCRRPSVRALIEKLSSVFAQETVGTILQAHRDGIEAGANALTLIRSTQGEGDPDSILESAKLATATKDLLETSDRMMKRSGQAMGLFPSPAQSIFLQQIFNGPSQIVLGDQVARILGQATRQIQLTEEDSQADIIDSGLLG
jgi:hypothetical protein